ncbi:hypothetical protein K7432_007305 [Basidiobolus ranarum]|uniref:Uncharacterized protein n=1 Tax=Basidiobolus ranarum TaxID=34480 RepID=A0ABR2W0J6_9FUNG
MTKIWSWRVPLLVLLLNLTCSIQGQSTANTTESCVYREGASKSTCKNEMYTCDKDTRTCILKGCKYDLDDTKSEHLPLCQDDYYCPYDQTKCQPKIATGDQCSLKNGDVCQGDFVMCFQGSCSSRNASLGAACEIDKLSSYVYDNCLTNTYCSDDKICVASLSSGETCSSNRQCQSTDCFEGRCRVNHDQELYHSLPVWVYIVIGVGCFVAILTCALFIYFRRRRRIRNYKKMLTLPVATSSNPGSNSSLSEMSQETTEIGARS